MTAAVQIDESGYAIDNTNALTYVIIAVIESTNATDIYYCAPIFRLSGNVWHVSPRLDYWKQIERQSKVIVSTRSDDWKEPERQDKLIVSTRLTYWRPNE